MTETNVIVVDLPESEEKALNVALNSPGISGEFTDQLDDLPKEIREIEPELFTDLMLDKLLADPDAIPEPPDATVPKRGELYAPGNHH